MSCANFKRVDYHNFCLVLGFWSYVLGGKYTLVTSLCKQLGAVWGDGSFERVGFCKKLVKSGSLDTFGVVQTKLDFGNLGSCGSLHG